MFIIRIKIEGVVYLFVFGVTKKQRDAIGFPYLLVGETCYVAAFFLIEV